MLGYFRGGLKDGWVVRNGEESREEGRRGSVTSNRTEIVANLLLWVVWEGQVGREERQGDREDLRGKVRGGGGSIMVPSEVRNFYK